MCRATHANELRHTMGEPPDPGDAPFLPPELLLPIMELLSGGAGRFNKTDPS